MSKLLPLPPESTFAEWTVQDLADAVKQFRNENLDASARAGYGSLVICCCREMRDYLQLNLTK